MLTEKQLIEMIGDKPYYLKAYKKLREENKNTFNWGAAMGGYFWFIYRRMFLMSCLTLFLGLLAVLLCFFIPGNLISGKSSVIVISISVSLGRVGNKIYFYFIEKMHSKNYKNIGPTKRSLYIFLIAMFLIVITFDALVFHKIKNQSDFFLSIYSFTVFFIASLFCLVLLWLFSGEKRKAVFLFPFYK